MLDIQAIMVPAVHGVIQALAWITVVGLVYVAWLQTRPLASGFDFGLSHHAQQIVRTLQTLWVLLAFSLILTLLFFAYPLANQANASSARPVCSETRFSLVDIMHGCMDSGAAGDTSH